MKVPTRRAGTFNSKREGLKRSGGLPASLRGRKTL